MSHISELWLRSSDPDASHRFITSLLPKVSQGPRSAQTATVRFSRGAEPSPAAADGLANFWKFSVFTDNMDQLRASLFDDGVESSEAVQFGDIGYLSHLHEPGGNAIELIQRTFRQSAPLESESPDTLGLITLRVSDAEASMRFYIEGLGMRLLCTMAVDDGRPDPFDLYFLGYIDEDPPDPNPAGVANREWLYQRPAAFIELQHYRAPTPELQATPQVAPGLMHIVLTTDDHSALVDALTSIGVQVEIGPADASFLSPDGHQFRVLVSER